MQTGEVTAQTDDHVLRVTIRRPEKHNALSRAVLNDLRECFETLRTDPDLKIAVIQGEGTKSFAAGGDLVDLSQVRSDNDTQEMRAIGLSAFDAIRNFQVPVVAALNGDALGGGAELAVACDFRVAAANARIGFLQSRLNISTAWGGGPDLIELVGSRRALKLLCSAEVLSASEAFDLGIVDACAPDSDSFEATVNDFIGGLTHTSAEVIRTYKSMTAAARRDHASDTLVNAEAIGFARNWTHQDHWSAADRVLRKQPKE